MRGLQGKVLQLEVLAPGAAQQVDGGVLLVQRDPARHFEHVDLWVGGDHGRGIARGGLAVVLFDRLKKGGESGEHRLVGIQVVVHAAGDVVHLLGEADFPALKLALEQQVGREAEQHERQQDETGKGPPALGQHRLFHIQGGRPDTDCRHAR
ncbi:hypothetical protein D3C77_626530 [compost metagenome]